jgi:hypothetical protein
MVQGRLIPFNCFDVRMERLELSHLAALDPKSSVSTNSTTSAFLLFKNFV